MTLAEHQSLQFCKMKIFHLLEHTGLCQLDNQLSGSTSMLKYLDYAVSFIK